MLNHLLIPDLWQQDAVHALRDGKDVVVHAPTGAGKTYIFELLYPALRGQAVFTVPTRALANDKLAEWQAKGWDVGIATGDLALRLDAKVLVATLETQKGKFLQRTGPRLLVVDEYQMIGDPVRGVNYELALALAPKETQLLLLSGSVANPQAIVDWLRRIGRDAVLVSHSQRPVPLEEVDLYSLPKRAKAHQRSDWPGWVNNALHADLGPILMFAPRRNAAEDLARQLAAALPPSTPLILSAEQQTLAGPRLTRLLQARVAYHHSGLSYAQRAGLIEPLAKNGQLRVVVATMGLAAGINFSMRSVLVTDTTYKAGSFERQVQPDELLQMFGRAGRRGLDDTGYALVVDRPPRLSDARPRQLRRANPVDWPTLLAVMRGAADRGADPFEAALELNRRLFTPIEIPLGVEHCRGTGAMPCQLAVDMERARFARRGLVEILNSNSQWEPRPAQTETAHLGEVLIQQGGRWRPALSLPKNLEQLGFGNLCILNAGNDKRYGREVVVGTRAADGQFILAPWLRKITQLSRVDTLRLQSDIIPQLEAYYRRAMLSAPNAAAAKLSAATSPAAPAQLAAPPSNPLAATHVRATLSAIHPRNDQLIARWSFEHTEIPVWRDSLGRALWAPPDRQALPALCQSCPERPWCQSVEIIPSPAHAWRRLGLIEPDGTPTRRGIVFSFFHHGEGLAVAAALEDTQYPIDDLVFDLANLRAGQRFAGEDSPYGGRLGALCQQKFERADWPGYLEMGVPLDYGAGASEIVREMVERQTPRQKLLTESLRQGDLERALVEWRSLLRHILWAPDYDWDRWRQLKVSAGRQVDTSVSPILGALPALTSAQQRRLK